MDTAPATHVCLAQIEFAHPPLSEQEQKDYAFDLVPFLAMPGLFLSPFSPIRHTHRRTWLFFIICFVMHPIDSVHMADKDSVFFILPPKDDAKAVPPVYGVVCFQQVDSASVRAASTAAQTREITRNAVQKSVCLLLSQPLFETYHQRLLPVTQSFFAQRDFEPKVLVDFYDSLVAQQQQQQKEKQQEQQQVADIVYQNHCRVVEDVPVRELVQRYGARRALQLLKLVLAEQSVVIAACRGHIHRACQLAMLAGAALPLFFGAPPFFSVPAAEEKQQQQEQEQQEKEGAGAEGAEKTMAARLWEEGFPLRVLGSDDAARRETEFAPYVCLQQMAALSQKRFFVAGVSNPLFLRAAATNAAAVLDVDHAGATIAFGSARAQGIAELTGADRRFADSLDAAVRTATTGFVGSSQWLLAQLTAYTEGLLACYAARQLRALAPKDEQQPQQQQQQQPQDASSSSVPERNDLGLYGAAFVAAWEQTASFAAWWAGQTRTGTAARVWPAARAVHPGGESVLQVLGRDLQRGFREDIQPLAARIGTTVSTAATTFGHAVKENALRAQAAIKESAERRRAADAAAKDEQPQPQQPQQPQQQPQKQEEASVQQKVSGWWSAFSRNVADTVTRVGKTMDDGLTWLLEPQPAAAADPAADPAADESVFDTPPLLSEDAPAAAPAEQPTDEQQKPQEQPQPQQHQQ